MTQHRRIIHTAVAAGCIFALALVLVSLSSNDVRYVALPMITSWQGKLNGIQSVYIGDSITSGGRNWGAILGTINLAKDGYTVRQIETQLGQAKEYSPKRIIMLAGTNDILARRTVDLKQFESDYSSLLGRAQQTGAEVIITLIPLTSRADANEIIPQANQIILKLAHSRGISIIDLNPTIAPQGTLLTQYTVDGVHFTDAAYSLWRAEIEAAIRKSEARQDAAAKAGKPRG